jgi:hypothetical protein
MAKTESTFKNMVLSLTLLALVASACLGFVYERTKKPIELSVLNKKLDAIKLVVPGFTNDPNSEFFRLRAAACARSAGEATSASRANWFLSPILALRPHLDVSMVRRPDLQRARRGCRR